MSRGRRVHLRMAFVPAELDDGERIHRSIELRVGEVLGLKTSSKSRMMRMT